MSLLSSIAKSRRMEAAVAGAFAAYLRLAFATTRWDYTGVEDLRADLDRHGAVIVACWHQRIMYSAPAWAVTGKPLAGLHSRSRAGRLAGAIQRRLGLKSVAMHDSRSNRAASLAVARMMKDGTSLGLAADGPLGPARQLNPALLEWARLTGKPIWFQAFSVRRSWTWSSWDACMFPFPFTRGVIAYSRCETPVPRRAEGADMDALATRIGSQLSALTDRADAAVRAP